MSKETGPLMYLMREWQIVRVNIGTNQGVQPCAFQAEIKAAGTGVRVSLHSDAIKLAENMAKRHAQNATRINAQHRQGELSHGPLLWAKGVLAVVAVTKLAGINNIDFVDNAKPHIGTSLHVKASSKDSLLTNQHTPDDAIFVATKIEEDCVIVAGWKSGRAAKVNWADHFNRSAPCYLLPFSELNALASLPEHGTNWYFATNKKEAK